MDLDWMEHDIQHTLHYTLSHLEDAVHKARVPSVHKAGYSPRPLPWTKRGRAREDIEAGGHGAAQREAGHVLRHELGQRHPGVRRVTYVNTLLSEMYNMKRNANGHTTRIMIYRCLVREY